MKDTGFESIAIIGIGLIGSSFALSLKKRGYECHITGLGRSRENLARAAHLGIIDSQSPISAGGVRDADLIMLATPVGELEKVFDKISNGIAKGAIVTDVGSVKAGIIGRLEALMPEGVSFVGGHPITGRECSGISGATNELFDHAKCILTPTSKTDKSALVKVRDLWEAVGSEILIMSPEEHDSIFAAVSHLPHAAAYAMVNSIMEMDKNILYFSGKGLRDMTRIALSPPDLWRDICANNRENLLKSLRNYSANLSRITQLVEASDWKRLEKEFRKARKARKIIESD